MRKHVFICLLFLAGGFCSYAEDTYTAVHDTIRSKYLDEIVISASTKETNSLKTLPGSISIITPGMIEGQKIITLKDLSTTIPNFFIPDYGSRLSTPVYIRGIGERSTGQSIGMYVDNMPYLNKADFDFDFMDISRIEVLRGPQGTLYGRNAMSGIVNVTTPSPLYSQYRKISLTAGNYGLFRAKASVSELLSKNTAISVSGYYDGDNGFFINQMDGKRADKLRSGGAKIRFDWQINPNWVAQFEGNYDHSYQGAFPYGVYKNHKISEPDYDASGKYNRKIAGGNFNLKFENDVLIFNSNTGFLYLDDDMKMDTDNSPQDVFKLNQLQKEKSWTEELTLKSNSKSNYQWSFGAFGFHTGLETNVVTTMGANGIRSIMQLMLDQLHEANPGMPTMTVTNDNIPIPGTFQTPTYGGAIFHQSTYNNLFVDGLSLTAGIRLDYEKTKLDYDTQIAMDMNMSMNIPGFPARSVHADTTLLGNESMHFTELLPKVAVKYEFTPRTYVYATVSNGYKTGGYNIQNFADIAQAAIRQKYDPNFKSPSVSDRVPYKPEYSWNYEIGYKGEVIKDRLYAEAAAFYINVKDIQITDFVESGQGRIVKNAGKAKSAGLEASITAFLSKEFQLNLNYGLTQAEFRDYRVDSLNNYAGNKVPFAPQNTLSISAIYSKNFKNKWIDRLHAQALFNGAGKIYWTESNDVCQNFYGLLHLRAGVNKGIVGINLWANNVLNTKYTAFYFESMNQKLAQAGKPFQFGVDAIISF
ncbi:MAG: TonB-dependent receptor [Candidatus Azobacteroides sp.]|nr:TonB-dependent receptor [Candidatus Azobacteroides sp.]